MMAKIKNSIGVSALITYMGFAFIIGFASLLYFVIKPIQAYKLKHKIEAKLPYEEFKVGTGMNIRVLTAPYNTNYVCVVVHQRYPSCYPKGDSTK